ncbi:hypothetical protein LCGC14_1621990 [marine sediment metagenome]|uniref:Uncharacterized protein n=1 Tax=marine sediment metagenome TaxID=412755 RepID=A0A0F9L577_9ZZZZ
MNDTELTERAAGILGLTEQQLGVDLYWRSSHFNIRKADFDPLNLWRDAGLLMEKIRGMPKNVQFDFCYALIKDVPEGGEAILALTPRAITIAAIEAAKGEKG